MNDEVADAMAAAMIKETSVEAVGLSFWAMIGGGMIGVKSILVEPGKLVIRLKE